MRWVRALAGTLFPSSQTVVIKRRSALSTPGAPRLTWSGYVGSLRTLGALGDLKLDWIALLQTLVSFRGDGAVMDEDIGSSVPSDKSVALCVVKPLNCTFQTFHLRPLKGTVLSMLARASRLLTF